MATIRKRGSAYQIRVSCGYDAKGKHVEQAMTWKPDEGLSERQIQKELNRQAVMFEEACLRGRVVSSIKFEIFAEQWLEEYAKTNLRSTTYERQLQLRKRIYSAIGHMRLDRITVRHIQVFVNSLSKEGANQKTGKPLAPKTIRHHLSFISTVFNYGMKMDLISDNPCSKVSIPKGEEKEKVIYTPQELEKFIDLLQNEPLKYQSFFMLITYSGFRRSEMLGLEWKDINWEHNIIKIRRTSNYTAQRGIYTDSTKTKKSQRVLKFPGFIMDLLKKYKAEQDAEVLRLGDKWVDNDRLFVKWNGQPMNNQTMYWWLSEFAVKHEIPFYGIHHFRHLFSSYLIHAGLDVVSVSGALGHCEPGVTLKVYSHAFQEAQAKISDTICNALAFTRKQKEA